MDISETTELIGILDTAVKIGLGALISGVATYFVTKLKQENDAKRELHAWLREKQHSAYSQLARCIMAFSLDEEKTRSPFQDFALLSEAVLLTEDEGLIDELDEFFHDLERMNRLTDNGGEESKTEADRIYSKIYRKRLEFVRRLRDSLKSPNKSLKLTAERGG